jgi:hypothetical protein
MSHILEGGCLCGEVRYRASGRPTHRMLCHCKTCRQAAGSPVVAWVTFPTASFDLVHGSPISFRSSSLVIRTFCGSCGTPLTYEHSQAVGAIDVTTCSFDQPDLLPPTHHSWLQDSVSWILFGDGLPTHHTTSSEG